ncbi:hypothetical protein JRI60_24655 [Archangium violaceum]|uniref:nucleotide disphospho-sugar-binding domain-containing protein n=1 Tax=Archangium violaceum TaxID=83451 RepID=UPI00194FC941|nr:nucleotide disphospho-sugar-binding domain-containing protein [Archangium violaceum]QRO01979.1 hypothetical protein JRI60_24655 [Archangium violaceum]
MATIVVSPIDQQGHVNPSLRIAKGLRERGHRVVYCGLADLEDFIKAEGFEFVPVLADLCPKGFQARVLEQVKELSGLRLYQFSREMDRQEERMLAAMQAGALDEPFTRLKPDLLLCDVMHPEPPLVAYGHKVPCVLLNTTLPMRREEGLPPLSSPLVPDGQLKTKLLIEAAWVRNTYRMRLRRLFRTRQVRHLLRLARRYGFPPEQLDFSGSTVSAWAPELVLCPREFAELGTSAGVPRGQYLYTGPSVDLERQEVDFPWERLREDRPLVLVYLGTLAFQTDLDARLFRHVLEVAARKPDWQFVLSLGRKLEVGAFDGVVPNVIAVRHAPQMAMLRRATAMITHGGFNSVKECISMGVPMVVIPMVYDQPGISARVVHHGVGVRAMPFQTTTESLLAQLDEVTTNPRYRSNVQAFRDRFRQAEELTPAADVIERFLERGAPAAARPVPTGRSA